MPNSPSPPAQGPARQIQRDVRPPGRQGAVRESALPRLPRIRRRLPARHRPGTETSPIAETRDLGWMLHDLDFSRPADPQPRFFQAS
jgi:hypothetical protein